MDNQLTNELKEKYNYDLPEEEIAYLVIHFQAAVERMNKQTND